MTGRLAVRFVVALPSEAKPINHHFGLVRDNSAQEFSLYRKGSQALVISGVGMQLAARATAWLQGRLPGPAVWFNIGIAGHPRLPVGKALLAHEIVDRASGIRWHNPYSSPLPCPSSRLISCVAPETDYPDDALYDMEGAGFYATLGEAGTSHSAHCFKIVSDNLQNPVHRIDRETITRLMEQNLPLLERLCAQFDAGTEARQPR